MTTTATLMMSIAAFVLLAGYLAVMAFRYGVPDMVSDTYYQLRGEKGTASLLFTLVLLAVVFLMLPCLMESGRGFQPFAFWGCAGLAFVAVSPAYLSADQCTIHKAGAITAATGCVFWCLTASVWPTLIITTLYALYLALTSLLRTLNGIWYISKPTLTFHPWYWAEVCAFADVFVTYWVG